MKIKNEFFEIAKDARDEAGEKLPPEQQPALIVQNVEGAPVSVAGQSVGQLPIQIARATTVGELADVGGRLCAHCSHWDRTRWNKLIGMAANGIGSPEEIHAINDVRAAILQSGNADVSEQYEGDDGDTDLEQALHSMGICHALTEHERATDPMMGPKELVVTFPRACCPLSVVTPTQPNGFFKARDREAEEAGGANRDDVLLGAIGKERAP